MATKADFENLVKNLNTKLATTTKIVSNVATTATEKHSSEYVPTLKKFSEAMELKSAADMAQAAHLANLTEQHVQSVEQTGNALTQLQESMNSIFNFFLGGTKVLGDTVISIFGSMNGNAIADSDV